MSFTVFLGNLPTWVTADDIKQWLAAEDLVADAVKVIRNHETQESKGFAFVEAPTADEMPRSFAASIALLLKTACCALIPPSPRRARTASPRPQGATASASRPKGDWQRPDRKKRGGRDRDQTPRSAFATELAKVL